MIEFFYVLGMIMLGFIIFELTRTSKPKICAGMHVEFIDGAGRRIRGVVLGEREDGLLEVSHELHWPYKTVWPFSPKALEMVERRKRGRDRRR